MAEPALIGIKGLESAILKELERLHPYIIDVIDKLSPENRAKPKLDSNGRLLDFVNPDGSIVPREQYPELARSLEFLQFTVSHMNTEVSTHLGEIFDSKHLSNADKAVQVRTFLQGAITAMRAFNVPSQQEYIDCYASVVEECSKLCKAFLEKQQAALKGSGFGGLGS